VATPGVESLRIEFTNGIDPEMAIKKHRIIAANNKRSFQSPEPCRKNNLYFPAQELQLRFDSSKSKKQKCSRGLGICI
jgi:hypothetical protein